MNKSIGMLDELIKQINSGYKTQTIRLAKHNPELILGFKSQFKVYNPKIHDLDNFTAIQLALNESKYLTNDLVVIEGSNIVIKIESVQINQLSKLTDKTLVKEGIKSSLSAKNILLYFDYQKEIYNLKTINESFLTLMSKCYGDDIIHTNPYVFVYEFRKIE